MAELKPCPFCGGKGKAVEKTDCIGHGEFVSTTFVRCTSCGATGRKITNWEFKGDCLDRGWIAINEWNRRAEDGSA